MACARLAVTRQPPVHNVRESGAFESYVDVRTCYSHLSALSLCHAAQSLDAVYGASVRSAAAHALAVVERSSSSCSSLSSSPGIPLASSEAAAAPCSLTVAKLKYEKGKLERELKIAVDLAKAAADE